MKQAWNWFLTTAIVVCAGCSGGSDLPTLAAVEGVVTYQGKPLPSANIIFSPDSGPIATGTTNDEGYFTLLTQGKAGAVIGNHQVMIQAMAPKAGSELTTDPQGGSEPIAQLVSAIPEKYGTSGLSPLTAVVDEKKTNELQFDLE